MEDVRVAKRCNAWYVGIFIRLKEKRRRENLKIMLINYVGNECEGRILYKVLVDLIDKCGMVYTFYNQYWNIFKNIIISFEQFTLRDIDTINFDD